MSKNPKHILEQLVPHPQGGYTLAIPVGKDSTARIYSGWWPHRPKPKKISERRAAP